MKIGAKVKSALNSTKKTFTRPNARNMNFNLSKTKQGAQSFRKTTPIDRAAHSSGLFRKGGRDQAGKEMRNIKSAGISAKDNFNLAGGWKTAAGSAGTGAIAGGLAGAGVNTIRGEDAWEGAKTGAMLGAVGNGGVKSARMGMGASKTQKFGNAFTNFNAETGMTKSVKSLHTLAKDSRDANRIVKRG